MLEDPPELYVYLSSEIIATGHRLVVAKGRICVRSKKISECNPPRVHRETLRAGCVLGSRRCKGRGAVFVMDNEIMD